MKRGGRLTSRASLDPGCGKRRYRSQLAAEKALARISGLPGADEGKVPQRAYECDRCAYFHLTSMAPAKWTRPATAVKAAPSSRRDTGFSPAVKLGIRTRAGSGDPASAVAECCGIWLGRYGGEIQHIIARGSGGTSRPVINSVINGVLMCHEHHREAESRSPEWYDRGFWRWSTEKPGAAALEMHTADGGFTRYLAPDGSYSTEPVLARGGAA